MAAVATGLATVMAWVAAAAASTPAAATQVIVGPSHWHQFDMSPTHNAVYHAAGAGVSWSLELKSQPLWLMVVKHTVYLGSLGGVVHAIDATTGQVRWRSRPTLAQDAWQLTYAQGRIYGGTGNSIFAMMKPGDWCRGTAMKGGFSLGVFALDPATGKTLWTLPTSCTTSVTAFHGGVLFAPDRHNWLRAIDPATGKLLWKVPDGGVDDVSYPAISHGVIYLNAGGPRPPGLRAFKLHAAAATPATKVWSYLDTDADNAPTVGDGVIMTTNCLPITSNGKEYMQDQMVGVSLAGKLLWSHTTQAGPRPFSYCAPDGTYAHGVFYVGSWETPYLYAFAATTGKILWRSRLQAHVGATNPVIAGGYAFVTTVNGYVDAVNLATGKIAGTKFLRPAVLGSPVLVDGTLFIPGWSGGSKQVNLGILVPGYVWAVPVRELLPAWPAG